MKRGFIEVLSGLAIGSSVLLMLVLLFRGLPHREVSASTKPAPDQTVEILGGVPFGLQAAVIQLSNGERVMVVCGDSGITAVKLTEPGGLQTLPFPGTHDWRRQFER